LELKLEEQAHLDPLTGLANRRRLEDRAREEVERAQRFNRPLSLMIMDLDHFKSINDRYGHLFGDAVLRRLADLGRSHLRQTDLFARVGGEEFVVLMPETTRETAVATAERLRALLAANPVTRQDGPDTGPVDVSVSIGIAAHGPDTPTVESLMAEADKALYVAKNRGRNCVVAMQ